MRDTHVKNIMCKDAIYAKCKWFDSLLMPQLGQMKHILPMMQENNQCWEGNRSLGI